jgi:phosphatidate cytidylyltransferase
MTLVVCWEYFNISIQAGYYPSKIIGIIAAVAVVVGAYFRLELIGVIALLLLISTPVWNDINTPPSKLSFANWAITIVGFLYSGGLLLHFLLLRDLSKGLVYGIMVLFGTWASDTCAYLIGRYFGRHKFFPHLSPKKTWEGAIGGFICGLMVVYIIGAFTDIELIHRLALGVIIPISVISGDLIESMLKRSAGVKNASNLIPGHGGLLDRIDGLIFAVTTAYYYISRVIGN